MSSCRWSITTFFHELTTHPGIDGLLVLQSDSKLRISVVCSSAVVLTPLVATNSSIGWRPWPRAHIEAGSICTMTSSRKHSDSDPYNFWHVIMLALIISDQAAPDRNTCRSMLDSIYIICTICNYSLCESLYSSKSLHELFVKNIVPSLFQEKTMLPKCNKQKRDATWSLHSESRISVANFCHAVVKVK